MIITEHMRIDPAYRGRLQACGLDSVPKVLSYVGGRVAAWSRTTDTRFVPGPDGTPGFYVKRYFFPTWGKRLRGMFRGTFLGRHRGHAEYRALAAMRASGVPAVRPVAYGERRIAHFLCACFLITEEVPEARDLTRLALDVTAGRRPLSRAQRGLLLRSLAQQLAAMHAVGCSHGNLFWRNVLVRYAPDDRPEFFFLDAQPLRSWERLAPGGAWWLRELAQLTVSAQPFTTRTERLRFIRCYLADRGSVGQFRSQLACIERLAETWRHHEQRRIRMTALFERWNRQLLQEQRPSSAGKQAGTEESPP